MVGDVTAAVDRDQLGTDVRRVTAEVAFEVSVTAVGEDVVVFEEQEVFGRAALAEPSLEIEGLALRDSSEPANPERTAHLRVPPTSPGSRGSP